MLFIHSCNLIIPDEYIILNHYWLAPSAVERVGKAAEGGEGKRDLRNSTKRGETGLGWGPFVPAKLLPSQHTKNGSRDGVETPWLSLSLPVSSTHGEGLVLFSFPLNPRSDWGETRGF